MEKKSYELINSDLINQFCENELFAEEECSLWDYKKKFPFSRSDQYCGGIIRLICAFHNTFGGIIMFGVHDTERTGGHNDVRINIESFNTFLREVLSNSIECRLIRIPTNCSTGRGAIDILVVPKRSPSVQPITAIRPFPKYRSGVIWFRNNAEVLKLENKYLPAIFSTRDYIGGLNNRIDRVEEILPPNPATMTSFIGRVGLISELWEWVFNKRDPRKYLYGDGGSGKTTIAYEFASLIAESGGSVSNLSGAPYDKVILLSAKNRKLNIENANIEEVSNDFFDARSLYCAILFYSDLFQEEEYESDTIENLVDKLESLFATAHILLVIDDIDTLTTAGIDTGTDALNDAISRSRGRSKILYTLRNLPGLSRGNSFEVPGLDYEDEYPKFIDICSAQFKVSMPSQDLIKGKFWNISQGRPLVLEVLIGLRRKYQNYEDCIQAYESVAGKNAREYMFMREYNALAQRHSKNLLATLYLWNKPIGYTELRLSLGIQDSDIADAIGEVNEMFLFRHFDDVSENTQFALNSVAEHFIGSVCLSVDKYEVLKERISTSKKGKHKDNPIVANLIHQTKTYEKRDDFQTAYTLLFESSYPPSVTERPDFRALRGHVIIHQKRPDRQKAREELELATGLGPIRVPIMRKWLQFEASYSDSYKYQLSICDRIINGKGYRKYEKAEFLGKKGYIYSEFAKSTYLNMPEKAKEYYLKSIECNLNAYFTSSGSNKPNLLELGRFAKTSIYYTYKVFVEQNEFPQFCSVFITFLEDKSCFCDPFYLFFKENKQLIVGSGRQNSNQTLGALANLKTKISRNSTAFLNDKNKDDLLFTINGIIAALS
tara:strand:+ start:1902 stop:4397 length:2496 start_codon:yes stop_codon:yes gene_type:complete